ncbi:MAG TPA: hypothetical protein VFK16_09655 [Gemmatimonadaceae bacterium]|jgi:hypothetical protein|nr:hypothetical protein [Gemmatimonadaceae bacterium]
MALVQAGGDGAPVRLAYRPHAGDTLRLVFEQRAELASRPAGATADADTSARRTSSGFRVYSRVIVDSSNAAGALVTSMVDSVEVRWNDQVMPAMGQQIQRALAGVATRMRILPDGAVRMESARMAPGAPASSAVPMASPAMLPRAPVRVGETWTGSIPVPSAGPLGPSADGSLENTYRLDSLGGGGRTAWISVHGFFMPDANQDSVGRTTAGSVVGVLRLDQRRGWITDSRLTILLRTRTGPAADTTGAGTVFDMRITQRVRAMDNRQGGG